MRYLLIAMLVVLLSGAAATAPERPETWRQAYQHRAFAPQAIADFDEARSRMDAEMDKLIGNCELSADGARCLSKKLEDLEYEYISKWYGKPDEEWPPLNKQHQTNSSLESNYREAVSTNMPGPMPPKSSAKQAKPKKSAKPAKHKH